jgi:hypothetical protein
MKNKKATYTLTNGKERIVQYNPNMPCRICGKPVIAASMGGTDVCSWCDCGVNRDGTKKDWKKLR